MEIFIYFRYEQSKRKRSLQDDWKEKFDWVEFEGDEMFCRVCRKFPDLCDTTSTLYKGITGKYRIETLKYHNKSEKHQKCADKEHAIDNPTDTPLIKGFQKIDELNAPLFETLFNTAYYIAQQNESFLKYPELLNLMEKNGLHIGENYRNDKTCQLFCSTAADVLKDEVKEDLKSTRYISVLSDGSTDKGIREQELVYVRYVDGQGHLKTRLADIVQLKHGHAEGVRDGILEGLENVGVNRNVLVNKLVGVNTDGAAVNLGHKGGAVKLLRDSINLAAGDESDCSEYMTVVHCVAHNLELAVCDSKKECPYLSDFEKVLKGIFQLYYYSPKRRRELYEIAVNLDKELKHYGGVQQIRWVASQKRALQALLDNYEVTLIHLQEIASGRDDNSDKAKNYLKHLTTEKFLTFLHFMIDWTTLLSNMSEMFQEKTCLISQIGSRVNELKQNLNKMKTKRGKMLRQFLREKDGGTFRGAEITQTAERRGRVQDTPESIKQDIDDLLSSTEFFLEERFIKHIGGEPHSLFSVFDFSAWPANDEDHREEFQDFGDEQIEQLLRIYPARLLTNDEKENAIDEWLDLKLYMTRRRHETVLKGYENMLGSPDSNHIKNISLLVQIMLTISPSTAECERGFSQMNLIKTERRTRLQYESLASLVRINIDGPSLMEFDPKPAISKWLKDSRGKRHIKGHKLSGPRPRHHVITSSSSSSSDSE